MRILIIGGTRFMGRQLTAEALEAGHDVTLFNRGQTNPGLFAQVENLVGDRDRDLSALKGRSWDAVVDTCGYVPRSVTASVEALKGSVDRYVFVSTVSVYAKPFAGMDESAPLAPMPEGAPDDQVTGETYGPLKVLCEKIVEDAFGDRALNVRPGLIVGPHDPTDRFTYWPHRVAQGGNVLAPGDPSGAQQAIEARDLGRWIVKLIEDGASGAYNGTGPEKPWTMGELLETCRDVSGSDANFIWIEEDKLLEAGAGPWMEVPLWVPVAMAGLMETDVSKSVASGLLFRSLEEIVRDTLEWDRSLGERKLAAGMSAEREAELLKACGY